MLFHQTNNLQERYSWGLPANLCRLRTATLLKCNRLALILKLPKDEFTGFYRLVPLCSLCDVQYQTLLLLMIGRLPRQELPMTLLKRSIDQEGTPHLPFVMDVANLGQQKLDEQRHIRRVEYVYNYKTQCSICLGRMAKIVVLFVFVAYSSGTALPALQAKCTCPPRNGSPSLSCES